MNRLNIDIYNQDAVGIWVSELIAADNIHAFYTCSYWLNLRQEVLDEYKNECQMCKERGFYTRANTVHHVQYVRKHPRLALSKEYIFKDKVYKNLIPLCKDCHEEIHGYRKKKVEKPLTEERW